MLAILDVHYRDPSARAACLLFAGWSDAHPTQSLVADIAQVAPYQPGRFFERELPCLLAVLRLASPVECVVIDGYVWLDQSGAPGLGAHLYDALGKTTPVIGIAKTTFKGSPMAGTVSRATSKHPLYVTSAGMTTAEAVALVGTMHGPSRIPTLVRLVDQLSRSQPST